MLHFKIKKSYFPEGWKLYVRGLFKYYSMNDKVYSSSTEALKAINEWVENTTYIVHVVNN